jgi:porin
MRREIIRKVALAALMVPILLLVGLLEAACAQSLWEQSRLTGDWGGARSQLEAAGVTMDLEYTQFYQGLMSGAGPKTPNYGGRMDGFVKLDTGKLGLWQGGALYTHTEDRFGPLAGSLGGAFFPTNAAMQFPGESPATLVATSIYLSQRFGDRTSLLIGKINALDLFANDLFFGGWGTRRFINTIFVAPPSGLIPPVFYGAIANVRLDPVTLSLWVYDPDDRTKDYWPNGLFANGVSYNLSAAYATVIGGRPTTFSLNGIYTTKAGPDFSSVSVDLVNGGLKTTDKEGSYSIGFQFSHLLHLNPGNPKQGWGVFLKGSISDGNPNYVQNSLYGGIGGMGLFRGRDLDSFGVGYYYYNLSDALEETLNHRIERFGDEQGVEAYYSCAVTPWLYITPDLQLIDPPGNVKEIAFIAGLRTNIRF